MTCFFVFPLSILSFDIGELSLTHTHTHTAAGLQYVKCVVQYLFRQLHDGSSNKALFLLSTKQEENRGRIQR